MIELRLKSKNFIIKKLIWSDCRIIYSNTLSGVVAIVELGGNYHQDAK